jgi:PPOX class probable F420-dependent enzyme
MESGLSDEQVLSQFAGKTYLSLETYRRDGRPVRTTVWFVLEQDALYIRTLRDSGKAGRIRGNANVRVVPSSFGGKPTGGWIEATAEPVDEKNSTRIHDLFKGKYGIQIMLTDLRARIRRKKYVMYMIKTLRWMRPADDQRRSEDL